MRYLILLSTLFFTVNVFAFIEEPKSCDSLKIETVLLYDKLKNTYPTDELWLNTIGHLMRVSDSCNLEIIIPADILNEVVIDEDYILRKETLGIYAIASYVFAIFNTEDDEFEDMVKYGLSEMIDFYERMRLVNPDLNSRAVEDLKGLREKNNKWEKYIRKNIQGVD